MTKIKSPEATADYFVSYLFKKYGGVLHVRRVASWVGFIIMAISRVSKKGIEQRRVRQLQFDYKGRTFKVKYNHGIGQRGGIEIVEVSGGKIALQIASLAEAEKAYHSLEKDLDNFCKSN